MPAQILIFKMELHPVLETDTIPNPDLWFVVSAMGDCPSMRVGHTCAYIKGDEKHSGKVYVIGGANPSGPFNDTYVLDLQTLSWDFFESPGLRPRYEHAAFVPESQPTKIYVFGGADQSGNMNDVQVLDTTLNAWSCVSVQGCPPSARTHHTSAAVGDRLIIYSGGHCGADPVGDRKVHCFDASTCSWEVIPAKGDSPKPRHGHTMAAIGNKVYLHGGMAGSTFFDDFHVLDLDKGSWANVRRKGVYPSPRAAHNMVSVDTSLIVFGGMNQDGALDDMFKFSTGPHVFTFINPLVVCEVLWMIYNAVFFVCFCFLHTCQLLPFVQMSLTNMGKLWARLTLMNPGFL